MPAGTWIMVAWSFLLGASVGSFLNVVVYRLPAGKSLLRPGSRCPHCERPIRPWHNVPIFGWLLLRGRCYDCDAPISARYLLVELITAIWFALIVGIGFYLQTELASPYFWILWAFVANLVVLGCGVLCGLLIFLDREKVPRSLVVLTLVSALGVGILFAVLRTS